MNISLLTTEEKQKFLNQINSGDDRLLNYLKDLNQTLISLPEKITYLLSLTQELMREKYFSWEIFIKNVYEIFFFIMKSFEENPHPSNFSILDKFSIYILIIINQAYQEKYTELFYNRKENPLMEAIFKKIKEMNSFPLKIALANMSFISAKHDREILEKEILNFFRIKVNTQIEKIKSSNTYFYFAEFVKENLEAISKHFRKDDYRVMKGIQKGIMKKEKLKYLLHPIIISDNMNFYVMLESLNKTEFRSLRRNNVIPSEIISDLNINNNDDLIQISLEGRTICLPLFDFNEEESCKVHVVDEINKKNFFSMLTNDSRFILKKKKIQKACVFVPLKKENISLTDTSLIILGDEDYENLEKVLNVIIKNEKNIVSYFKFLNRIYGLEPCIYKVRLLTDILYRLSLNEQFHWKKFVNVMKLIFIHVQEWKSFANSEILIDKFLCHSLQIIDSCYALKMKEINYEIKENFILENILNEMTKMNLDNSMLEFVNLRNIRKKEKNMTQYDEKKYHFLKNLLEIERAKLLEKNYSFQLTYIEQLLKHFVKDKYRVIKCIRLKKFSQKKLTYLSHSIIIGEDDGMYLLLKAVSEMELSYIKEKYRISSKYLDKKIEIRDQKNQKIAQTEEPMKISIGKGAFGKIEISICLLENRKKNIFPGQLLCVKKTKHEGSIIGKKREAVSFSDIRDCTWNDYLSITNFTFSPEIYDMRIITHLKKKRLKKGYCFQKFIPVNDGSSFEKNKRFKKWKHQKKYFLDIIGALISFHENGICMTDLKPENTLYDLLTRKGTIIDLAGVVKRKNKEELKACKCKFIKESTKAYSAPEIIKYYDEDDQDDVEIDLPQAISFSIGKMIKNLVVNQMEATNNEEQQILDCILKLSENMTKDSPRERWTLEESLKFIQEIPTFEEEKPFQEIVSSYIKELKENLYRKEIRKIFGIKRKLKKILKGFYKDIEISKIDSEQANSEKTYNLNALEVLMGFIKSESILGEKELFLLMGAPGAGKSTILQFCFASFLKKWKWKSKDALPIYMNLGEETNIYLHWKKIKNVLNIEMSFHRINREINYPIILFLDCLDDSKRSLKLIESIVDDLDGSKRSIKILLTCKSGYFNINKEQQNLKLIKCNVQYLLPFSDDYLDNNDNIRELITCNFKKNKEEITNEELIHELVEKIERFELKKMMKTPFLIDLILKVLPNFKSSVNIDLLFLFEEYYNERFKLRSQKEQEIKSNFKFAIELAESMMNTIHQTNKLDKDDSSNLIKTYFNSIYNPSLPFFDQVAIIKIMKALDISIIAQNTAPNEEFHFSFPHDLIRKFFLVKGFLTKSKKNEFPKWMSHVSIVDDRDLIYLIVLAIEKDRKLIKFCRKSLKRTEKENYFGYLASNLITILVAANVSFYNENLSNLNIKGANLSDGIFTRCDFTNSDLSNVIINNCKFEEAKFKNTYLKDVELDIYPKIKVGFVIYKIGFSSKEDKIFVCGESETIKIFDLKDHDIEVELKGHVGIIKTLVVARYSDILISGGCDQMIKIWEFNLKKELLTLSGHKSEITCLALSSKETELLSGSKDNSIRVWDISKGMEIFKIPTISSYIPNVFFHKNEKEIIFIDLKNIVLFNSENGIKHNITHEEIVLALAYDHLNDKIASAVHNLILLWNINSLCFLKKLKGHEDAIQTLTYSKNFKFLISSGNDKNILIWDISSGLIFYKLVGHANVITSHQLSKNDDIIISGGFDKYLRIFSLNKKRKIKKYEGHNAEVAFLALTKDNLYFASASFDQTIGIWNVWNGKEEKKIKVKDIIIRVLCFLSPYRRLATGDEEGIISVWNIENGERLKKIDAHQDFINSLISSQNGQYLASGSSDYLIKIWLVQNDFEYLFQLNHDSIVNIICFSKNDSLIISAGEGEYIKIWDIASKNIIKELPTNNSTINAISLSNDYMTLASGDSMDQLIIWNLENPNLFIEPKMLPKYHRKQIFSILFLDDSTIISGGGDGMLYLWDLMNFNKIAEFIGHQSCIKSLIYCQEFDKIISGSEDKEIRIWDFNNKKKMEIEQYFSRIIIGSDATEFKGSKFIEEGREVEKRIVRIFIDS